MFVRWKKRKAAPEPFNWCGGPPRMFPHWIAVVVESKRVDGKPRQKVVMYLASIADNMRHNARQQVDFWRQVLSKLDTLELTEGQRVRMETALYRIVPRPSPEMMAEVQEPMGRDQALNYFLSDMAVNATGSSNQDSHAEHLLRPS